MSLFGSGKTVGVSVYDPPMPDPPRAFNWIRTIDKYLAVRNSRTKAIMTGPSDFDTLFHIPMFGDATYEVFLEGVFQGIKTNSEVQDILRKRIAGGICALVVVRLNEVAYVDGVVRLIRSTYVPNPIHSKSPPSYFWTPMEVYHWFSTSPNPPPHSPYRLQLLGMDGSLLVKRGHDPMLISNSNYSEGLFRATGGNPYGCLPADFAVAVKENIIIALQPDVSGIYNKRGSSFM